MMLEGVPISTFTAPSLLGVAVLLLLLGKIVPKATLLEKVEEAERWRKAYEAERDARVAADAQTAELLETAKTTYTLISTIFRNDDKPRLSGGPSVL